jgi:aldehyde dehydrogenase (NAD+)
VLRRAADLLEQRAESIGRDLTREEGKTLAEGVGEVRGGAAILRYYAGQCLEADGEIYPSQAPERLLFSRREPLGVIAAITPWNFPVAVPVWKLAPALAYGNTVVWKPSELVPLTSIQLHRVLEDAGLPPGTLNLLLGAADAGAALVAHEAIDGVTFTGSNAVGRRVQAIATERGKRVQLELGGKNPAVVLADADLGLAAEEVARAAFLSAGQKCVAASRVIVEAAVLPELAERLTCIARDWTVGDPLDPATRVGPLASEAQLERVRGYMDIARDDGATFLAGGAAKELEGGGYYFDLTVLADLPAASRVSREEVFGPVVTLIPAGDPDEAVQIANDTPFGLAASVFTRDLARAMRCVRDLRAGMVKVNTESTGLAFNAPFGGMKDSAAGPREQGKTAREFYTQWKTVFIDPGNGSS